MLKYMFVQDVVVKKQTTLANVNAISSKADLMTKCLTYEAHMKGCDAGSETQQRREISLATVTVT